MRNVLSKGLGADQITESCYLGYLAGRSEFSILRSFYLDQPGLEDIEIS